MTTQTTIKIWTVGAMLLLSEAAQAVPIRSIDRVSVSSASVEGNAASDSAAINQDGGVIAFRSDASNLVSSDQNGASDVFLRQVKTSATTRLSTTPAGQDSDGASGASGSTIRPISISSSGREICYPSAATNIVAGDSNGVTDLFVYTLTNSSNEAANVQSPTSLFLNNQDALGCALSGDGSAVSFSSNATNYSDPDANNSADIFIHPLSSFTIDLQSFNSNSEPGNNHSVEPSLSSDATVGAFASKASDLIGSGDTNGVSDIFIYFAGSPAALGRISTGGTSSTPVESNGDSTQPMVSSDGNYVVFTSVATNLVSSSTNGLSNIFLYDRVAASLELISVGRNDKPANGASELPSVSSDGRYVAFLSDATNLVAGDTNGVRDVFVRDREADVTVRVNLSSAGVQATLGASDAQISPDGTHLVFSSADSTLVSGDTNSVSDVFVVELAPIVTPDTTFDAPPEISVDQTLKKVIVTMPEFGGAAPDSSAAQAARIRPAARRRTRFDFRYQVTLTGTSGAALNDIRRRNTKRNEYAFKNLRTGSYSTAYRVGVFRITTTNGQERRRLVSFTAFSPSNTFDVN